MKKMMLYFLYFLIVSSMQLFAQKKSTANAGEENLFGQNLAGAIYNPAIWKDSSGVLTASKDDCIWSKNEYDNFILDLDFQNADGTNSGVIVHATDLVEWIPHAVEIQIADDYSKEWSQAEPTWQCAAIFGHKAATNKTLKKPGEWNHYTITCKGKMITVVLNGTKVNECNMDDYTSSKTNPDGTNVPSWLSTPMSALPLHGHIGLQGKHAGAPIYFKNIKIKSLS